MSGESLQARIEHEGAELRALYPHIRTCHTALVRWTNADGPHYSLHVDVRWPDHQTLVSGEAKDSAEAAIDAGFRNARDRLQEAAWASR